MKRFACFLCALGLTLWGARPTLALIDASLVAAGPVALSEGDSTDYTGDDASADDSAIEDDAGDGAQAAESGNVTDEATDDDTGVDEDTTIDDSSGDDSDVNADGGTLLDNNGDPVIYYAFQEKGGRNAGPSTARYHGTVSTSGPKLKPTSGRVTVAVSYASGSLTKLVFINHSSKGNVVITYNFLGNGRFTGTSVGSSTVTLNGRYKAIVKPGGSNIDLQVNESNQVKGRLIVRLTDRSLLARAYETKKGVTLDRQYIRATVVRGGQK